MFFFVACFMILSSIECQPGSRTDTKYCKMSYTGIEYDGIVSHTESGIPCQYWDSSNPTHEMDDSITSEDFKGGSKSAARNYCRNIKGKFSNPWCYTTNAEVADEICDIPLCNFDCRVTLAGVEYGGQHNESVSGRKCLKWSEKVYRKYLKKQNISTSHRILLDNKFPEQSRKKASNYCRNPTGDANGLWCMIEDDFVSKATYQKEYCEIKLCDEPKCTAATSRTYKDEYIFSHFMAMSSTTTEFEFSIQLWNIDFKDADLHIAFVVYPLPLNGEQILNMDNGIEFIITRHGVGSVSPTDEDTEWRKITDLLSGVKKRSFVITWYPQKSSISLKITDHPGEIEADYSKNVNRSSSIVGTNNGVLSYYSISGDTAFWNLPCPEGCLEEITILPRCNLHRRMRKTDISHEISFIVRSDHTIYIELRDTPNSKYPYFKIELLGELNKTSITFLESEHAFPSHLHSVTYENILKYWTWSKFTLSVSKNHLKLDRSTELIPSETILETEHDGIANAKWYSICSKGTAHWIFDCPLEDIPQLPERKPPECVQSKEDENYAGKQWVSKTGQPCFPWMHSEVAEFIKDVPFHQGTREEQRNYCRNLRRDQNGPYCYIADVSSLPDIVLKKESCSLRPCIGSQCKTTGMGRDYTGNLAVSRSNRTCKPEEEVYKVKPTMNTTMNTTVNATVSPSQTYCRNRDENLFGPWCFTTDPKVPRDLCHVEDCYVNDACTLLTSDFRKLRQFYLHPDWVRDVFPFKVKIWDPWHRAGIAIYILYQNTEQFFTLTIGSKDNQKVELSYCCVDNKTISLKENLIPNLIPTGAWQGFWLRLPPNNIELGYEGSSSSIFQWRRPSSGDSDESRIPLDFAKFISFTILNFYSWVGVNFPCHFCLIEVTENYYTTRYRGSDEPVFYPINYWSETNTFTKTLTLHIRTKQQGEHEQYFEIKLLGESGENFLIITMIKHEVKLIAEFDKILSHNTFGHTILVEDFWTTLTIKFDEHYLEVSDQRTTLLYWYTTIRVLRFYYFTVQSVNAVTTWVANCNRPSIDGPPVHGGWSEWSEWTCNVRCGGGIGRRERLCNNPSPNYKGKPCIGVSQEDGECATFECGCINPITVTNATNIIQRRAINKEAKKGSNITLKCEYGIMEVVKLDSPGSFVQWLKDGYRMKKRKWKFDKLDLRITDLHLSDLKEEDSGLYMCIINPDCLPPSNSTFIPFTIISLIVDVDQEYLARETTNYQLVCKGLPLSFIFTDLSQSWELDNELLIDYTSTDLAETNIDTLYEINSYYEGIWQCKIHQSKLKLTWITNRFKMKIIGPPTIYAYLSEEDAPSIIFHGWNHTVIFLFLWSVIIIEIIAVVYIVYWYWKVRQELLGNT